MIIREAKSTEEIRSLLLMALTDELIFTSWQRNGEGSLNFKAKAQLEEITAQGLLTFNLSEVSGDLKAEEIFFALEDTSILFKSSKLKLQDNKIMVSLPSEAKYKERRRHERVRFKIHERKDIEVLFPKRIQNDEDRYKVNSQLIDISESGACFLVSKETLQKINIDLIFSIKSLTNLKIGGEKAKVMNARRYKGPTLSQGEFYALGVMFI